MKRIITLIILLLTLLNANSQNYNIIDNGNGKSIVVTYIDQADTSFLGRICNIYMHEVNSNIPYKLTSISENFDTIQLLRPKVVVLDSIVKGAMHATIGDTINNLFYNCRNRLNINYSRNYVTDTSFILKFTNNYYNSSMLYNGVTYNNGDTIKKYAVGENAILYDSIGCVDTIVLDSIKCKIMISQNACRNVSSGYLYVINAPTNSTYMWNTSATTQSITGIGLDKYSVAVTYPNGTMCYDSIDLKNVNKYALNWITTRAKCEGQANGTATVKIKNGYRPFTIKWSTGDEIVTTETQHQEYNLNDGTYTVEVTDYRGCVQTTEPIINTITPLEIKTLALTPSACTFPTGTATATIKYGTLPYTYTWSNGVNVKKNTDMAPGDYTLKVVDANSCYRDTTITIRKLEPNVILSQSSITDNLITIGDITYPFYYILNKDSIYVETGQSSYQFNYNNSGFIGLHIYPSNGCDIDTTLHLTQGYAIINQLPIYRINSFHSSAISKKILTNTIIYFEDDENNSLYLVKETINTGIVDFSILLQEGKIIKITN